MSKIDQNVLEGQFQFPSPEDLQRLLHNRCKEAALALGVDLLEQEVVEKCGAPFSRKTAEKCYRGGSEQSWIALNGGKASIRRPRVRNSQGEIILETLNLLQAQDLLDEATKQKMLKGLSTRDYSEVIETVADKTGQSKSAVSRSFVRASKKALEDLNGSDLSEYRFIAIMIDGIEYAGRHVIGAIGITDNCQKIPLGIREGDTENSEVVLDLLSAILSRGFSLRCEHLLAVIDGSKALKKALKKIFGDRVLIQRCWLHKLRNIKSYLPKGHHGQITWRMKKLMNLKSNADAEKELSSLIQWLEEISFEAAGSMEEVGDELLTVHRLGCPRLLRKTLSCTNAIESLMSVCRRKTRNVTNWKAHPKQRRSIPRDKLLRWVAASIEQHRPKLRTLQGFRQVDELIESLNKKQNQKEVLIEEKRKQA